jgi:tRNA-specific 2-thiouridylase
MEICFVEGEIEPFVEQRLARGAATAANAATAETASASAAAAAAPDHRGAEVVDRSGRRLGTAGPYYRYTVGQRRGLGIAGGDRLYVLEIQPAERRVVVGGRRELSRNGLIGERLHWIGPPPAGTTEAVVRIRSRHAGVKSRIRTLPGRRADVEFAEPQEGVAPGQAAVFYDGSRILGGCWITGAQPE